MFASSFLTKSLEVSEIEILAKAMFPKRFAAGECIIKFGDVGTEYFVMAKGEV